MLWGEGFDTDLVCVLQLLVRGVRDVKMFDLQQVFWDVAGFRCWGVLQVLFWGVQNMKRIYLRQVFCDAVRCRFCVVFQVLFEESRRSTCSGCCLRQVFWGVAGVDLGCFYTRIVGVVLVLF